MPSHAWYAARASKKLAAHQAAHPPEQRIINRTDWDDVIQKRQNSKRIFISIASDPSVGICESREKAEAYFQEDGPPFTNSVRRKFVESAAICSQGSIIKDVPLARSCKAQVVYLFGAAMAAGNPVERAVQDNVLLWVDGPMVTKGLAHEIAREKPTPIPEDITAFLRKLFDPKFMVSLGSTRNVLLIALFVCLQVDCSGRVSEFLMPHLSKEDTAAYIEEHRDKMFTWGCVEVFAFKDQDADHVFLQARLTFRNIKGPGLNNKFRHKKTIPLRLLPPAFVAEDTLFWLVVLGLIDGVFAGVSSWSDINQLQPGSHGQSIPIEPRISEVPVFRADGLAAHLSEAHGLEVKMPKKVPAKNSRAKKAPIEEVPSSEEARPKKNKNKTKASARKTSAKKAPVAVISSDSEMEVWSDLEDAQPLQTRKAPARKASAGKASGNKGYVESSDSDNIQAKATAADRRPLGKKDLNRRAK